MAIQLQKIVNTLDNFFEVKKLEQDPGFSRFVPETYVAAGIDWRRFFTEQFSRRFNGLMIQGLDQVGRIFQGVFPSREVLTKFLEQAKPGDLFFSHHPLDMRCGDPRGEWSPVAFVPIDSDLLDALVSSGTAYYSCHAPLDYSKFLCTSRSMAAALGVRVTEEFMPYGNGNAGIIGEMQKATFAELKDQLCKIFQIDYIDFEGVERDDIVKVALVAGCGDVRSVMEEAESKGVQAYITGEIHCHIRNEYGLNRYAEIQEFAKVTNMALCAVSHAASEYLVHKNELSSWLAEQFNLEIVCIPEIKWWR